MTRNLLDESKNYTLLYEYETPILKNRKNHSEIFLRTHYGDPTCGNIDENNELCIVAGEGVSIYFYNTKKELNFLDTYCIHSINQIENNLIKILVDPWSEQHGTWILDLKSLKINKINNKPDMRDLPYQEIVEY